MYISKTAFIDAVAKCCPNLRLSTSKVFPYVEDMLVLADELGYDFDPDYFTTEVIEEAKMLQDYED